VASTGEAHQHGTHLVKTHERTAKMRVIFFIDKNAGYNYIQGRGESTNGNLKAHSNE
jgi:hypothetical protein